MKNALILHGAENNSQGNWFPWLKKELGKKGYQVWTPNLPDADSPMQKKWLGHIFSNKEWEFKLETVIIGHSMGATLVLRILENLPENVKINKAILVAGPIDKGGIPENFVYLEDLTRSPFHWKKIKDSCAQFYFIASDNDSYDCGERHAKLMHKNLGGEMIIIPGEDHFNLEKSNKYREFPLILDFIE